MTDEDRQAVERARYLNRTTDLRRRVCETIAYAERGYSSAGIAKKIDATEGTVSNYLDRASSRPPPTTPMSHRAARGASRRGLYEAPG